MIKAAWNSLKNTKWYRVVLWIIAVLLCVPFVIAARYSLFAADDFYPIDAFLNGNLFIESVKATISGWKNWQGAWFSWMVSNFGNPFLWGGFRALRISLMTMTVLSFAGLFFFVKAMLDFFDIDSRYLIYFSMLLLLSVVSFTEYHELYLWWDGSTVYFVPLILLEFGFSFMLLGAKRDKLWMMIVASVLMLCMGGGNLMVVGFGCFSSLLVLGGDALVNKKVNRRLMVPFLCGLAGGILNAAAPGNFNRNGIIDDSGVNVGASLWYSFSIACQRLLKILQLTYFPIILIVALLFGLCIKKRTSLESSLFVTIGCLINPIVTLFPFVLGYNYKYPNLPNRVRAISDISIYVSMIVLATYWGIWLSDNIVTTSDRLFAMRVVGIFAAIAIGVSAGSLYEDNVSLQIADNLCDGKVQKYAQDYQTIYAICENSPVDDLIIELPIHVRVEGCTLVDLSDNTEYWKNQFTARFYGLNSLALVNTYKK